MDLFRVERYMGEDEDKPDQQDETIRLKRLQRNIEDRKRKRQGVSHVSPLDSKIFTADIQEEENKKTKKKKTKSSRESEKKTKKQKRSSKQDTSTKCRDSEDKIIELSFAIDSDTLRNDSVEEKGANNAEKKSINIGTKHEKKPKKQFSKEGLIEEDSDHGFMDISVDSYSFRSTSSERKLVKNKEKKMKRAEDRPGKKLKNKSSTGGVTTDGGNGENMDISVDSEVNKATEKKMNAKKEKSISKDTGESEQGDISQESQDTAEEENKETGFTIIGGHKKDKEVKKVQRVLPDWLAKPVIINSDFGSGLLPVEQITYLDPHMINKLQQHDINHLFPVQRLVIPRILSQMETCSYFGKGGFQPNDICVSAPTGSGKTLAYVLPIVQSLLRRVVCHLRALIILPTKDLANQVKQVFEMFTEGTNLKVGLASGSKSFSKDQEQLVSHRSYGSSSRVDILICTPGRLVDHISSTPHFTLHHVQFLVIDEADRLLDQSYHGWLGKVLKAAYNMSSTTNGFIKSDGPICCNLQTFRDPPGQQTTTSFASIQLPLQKLLFSATMTHSPEKLAPLQLHQPILFTATGSGSQTDQHGVSTADAATSVRYSIPESLSEYMTICNNGEKPLMVLYCLTQLKFERVLCFASSLEATHRLYLLVKLFGGVQVAEYSSSLTPQQRKGILRDFKLSKLQLLICSDAMARGMDIQNVSYVISYDVPNYIRSYIHRVGRTARARNKGTAITLLHSDEVFHFKELIQKTGREKIPKYNIKEDKLQSMVDKYQETLTLLQDAVKLESQKKTPQKGKQQVMKLLQEQFMRNLLQRNSEENS